MRIGNHVAVVDAYYAKTGVSHAFQSGLNIQVDINDPALRAGFETVFALVPTHDGAWRRFDLSYGRPAQPWLTPTPHRWTTTLSDSQVDAAAASLHGVAIGIEMNGQTTWCQGGGENFPVYRY